MFVFLESKTVEYFHRAMSLLKSGDKSMILFEGEEDHCVPIHCLEALDSNLFYYTGMIISHSLLHDGFPFPGMSQAVVGYVITGSMDEAVPWLVPKDVPDLEIRQTMAKVNKT